MSHTATRTVYALDFAKEVARRIDEETGILLTAQALRDRDGLDKDISLTHVRNRFLEALKNIVSAEVHQTLTDQLDAFRASTIAAAVQDIAYGGGLTLREHTHWKECPPHQRALFGAFCIFLACVEDTAISAPDIAALQRVIQGDIHSTQMVVVVAPVHPAESRPLTPTELRWALLMTRSANITALAQALDGVIADKRQTLIFRVMHMVAERSAPPDIQSFRRIVERASLEYRSDKAGPN